MTTFYSMFPLSVNIFRHVSCRRAYKLLYRGTARKTDECINDFEDLNLLRKEEITNTSICQTVRYLNEERANGPVRWEYIHKKLKEENIKKPTLKIFQACLRLCDFDSGISYYEYLLGKGRKLDSQDLVFFCKVLSQDKQKIPKYEKLISRLYDDLKKDHFHSNSLIWPYVLDTFIHIPYCFNDIIKNQNEISSCKLHDQLAVKALEIKGHKVAFNIWKNSTTTSDEVFVTAYMNYCIKKLKDGTFSVSLIQELVDSIEKKTKTFSCENLENSFAPLLDALEKYDNKYNWSLSKCTVKQNNLCSNCKLFLSPKSLTKQEFKEVKDCLFDKYFKKKSIYLSSHTKEFESFLKFLDKSRPFNLVIDGLNLIYKKKNIGVQLSNRFLKYFLECGFQVLTIGRIHSKSVLYKACDFIPEKQRSNVQFFFTGDLSDDDVFIMYAALHSGLNTYVLTGDAFGHYIPESTKERNLFLRWQMTHQYIISNDLQLEPPLTHCNLPQLTASPDSKNDKYVWHLPNGKGVLLFRNQIVDWYCLQAVKKKS